MTKQSTKQFRNYGSMFNWACNAGQKSFWVCFSSKGKSFGVCEDDDIVINKTKHQQTSRVGISYPKTHVESQPWEIIPMTWCLVKSYWKVKKETTEKTNILLVTLYNQPIYVCKKYILTSYTCNLHPCKSYKTIHLQCVCTVRKRNQIHPKWWKLQARQWFDSSPQRLLIPEIFVDGVGWKYLRTPISSSFYLGAFLDIGSNKNNFFLANTVIRNDAFSNAMLDCKEGDSLVNMFLCVYFLFWTFQKCFGMDELSDLGAKDLGQRL